MIETKEELEIKNLVSDIESIIYSINKTGIGRIDELETQIDEIQDLIYEIKKIEEDEGE